MLYQVNIKPSLYTCLKDTDESTLLDTPSLISEVLLEVKADRNKGRQALSQGQGRKPRYGRGGQESKAEGMGYGVEE